MTTHLSKDIYEKLVGKLIDIKTNKYKNKRITYKSIEFDSMKEMSWYIKFELMQNAGLIKNLDRQVKYELQPSFKLNGKTIKAINYYADFTYKDKEDKLHVIDVKSEATKTQVYKLKKKLMAYKYGIEIEEI